MQAHFWKDKNVLVTGHTGFKGSWLSLWLHSLGARVTGYALEPPTQPSLFELLRLSTQVQSIIGDVRDLEHLQKVVQEYQPEIVIHMAAQPLVRESYRQPVETYASNLMGTVHILESARHCPSVKAIVNVTSDKCYQNNEWVWGYRESDPMGGHDPYSNSKGCSELITAAYRDSFFGAGGHAAGLASARAGNVIGGGDWAEDRLIPDLIRLLEGKGSTLSIRNPLATRPWQHVLEPLSGYLTLAERLYDQPRQYDSGWNFGPERSQIQPVQYIVQTFVEALGEAGVEISSLRNNLQWGQVEPQQNFHEAQTLALDTSKAVSLLNWKPQLDLSQTLEWIAGWTAAYLRGDEMLNFTNQQIKNYQEMLI